MTNQQENSEAETHSTQGESKKPRVGRISIGGGIVFVSVLIIAALMYYYVEIAGRIPFSSLEQQEFPESSESQSVPESEILEAAKAAGCNLNPGELMDPIRFTMVSQDRQLSMMSLGRDESDAAGAPPVSEGYTVGWFNEGPKIGSKQGKAVLTSHTYYEGTALGNELNSGLWKAGDILKIEDSAGNNACYAYKDNLHVFTADYDSDSSILYDDKNDPMFAMVVCSDWDETGTPLGRVIYYADLITSDYGQ